MPALYYYHVTRATEQTRKGFTKMAKITRDSFTHNGVVTPCTWRICPHSLWITVDRDSYTAKASITGVYEAAYTAIRGALETGADVDVDDEAMEAILDSMSFTEKRAAKVRKPVEAGKFPWISEVVTGEKRESDGKLRFRWTIRADVDMGKIAIEFDRFPGSRVIEALKADNWCYHGARKVWCKGINSRAHKKALAMHDTIRFM